MYVTRPLSMYRRDPSSLSLLPPGGPNSGVLVIQDEEAQPTSCFGLFKSRRVRDLPFPQNKNLKVQYVFQAGLHRHVHINRVVFIPVLNQPLSSNLYYVIERRGRDRGKAYVSSREEDMATCCFCSCASDVEPKYLNPKDSYQQFEIRRRDWGGFVAKSAAPDGIPPQFLGRKGWRVRASSTRQDFELTEALGINATLRGRLPDFNFPLSQKIANPVVVGKWYSPFMFIMEGTLKDQVDGPRYYEITLEQRWEQIFECEKTYNEGNSVAVDVVIQIEGVEVYGQEAVHDDNRVVGEVAWFRSLSREEVNVGLRLEVVERMRWEQERFGWVANNERQARVKRVEAFGGSGEWRKFGCYVLAERFVFRRLDGSLVLTCDFKHTNHIRSKWE